MSATPLIQYTSHSLVVTKNVISGTNLCSLFFLSYICIVHVYISQSISRCLVKMSYPVQIYALHFLAPYIYLSTVLAFRNNQKCHIQYKSMTLSCFFSYTGKVHIYIWIYNSYISEYISHHFILAKNAISGTTHWPKWKFNGFRCLNVSAY